MFFGLQHMSQARASQDATRPAKASRIVLIHHGRVRVLDVAPWMAAAAGTGLALLALVLLVAIGFLLFRDDALSALVAREIRLRQGYEDRIAALRSQIDRITSRQLLDQQAFEAKIAALLERQTSLEVRQQHMTGLLDAARNADGAASGPTRGFRASGLHDPSPAARSQAENRLIGLVGEVDRMLSRLETEQNETLERMQARSEQTVHRLRKTLADLGVRAPEAADTASGGPFIPLDPQTFDAFQARTLRLRRTLGLLDGLNRTIVRLPLRRPVDGSAVVTSGYGPRLDPFLGKPALHTGIDFRAPYGQPALATAPGRVVAAGRDGGYGNMVEVDHGNGYTTRYAHLSALFVKDGDIVKAGTPLGRIGSTGRSTGLHLHCETRVNGEPEDPTRWLTAGLRLGELLH